MSKHHTNALIVLGIVICAGFLIIPVTSNSGNGLYVLESGELLPFSRGGLLGAGNSSDDYVISEPSGSEEAQGLSPDDTREGGEVLLPPAAQKRGGTPPQAIDETPNASSQPSINNSAPPVWTDHHDDERLAALINTASIRLMRLSMEHAHALYLQDTAATSAAADDMYALSTRLIGEAQSLNVSPGQQPIKDEFIELLQAYSRVSQKILKMQESAPEAISELAEASEGLEDVSMQVGASKIKTAIVTTTPAAIPTVQARTSMQEQAISPIEMLPLQMRHTYDDPQGENMVSLLVESTKTTKGYHTVPINESAEKIEAGEGRMFLLVVVKSTNLGHKGDSDLYIIETPDRNAFTLEYHGETFAPIDVSAFTSLGESFDKETLDRYQSLKGYLYFDVPESLNVSEATLRADLGYAGVPVWGLGKLPVEEE